MKTTLRLAVGCAALLVAAAPRTASAQAVGIGTTPGTEAAAQPFPEGPSFLVYKNPELGFFAKPILGISGGLNFELQRNEHADGTKDPLQSTRTTLALVIFGAEARYKDWLVAHL
jgi:hypothetical protein